MSDETPLISPNSGTLLLGGGGSDEVSANFDREFSSRLPELSPSILYIPIAWSTDSATYGSCLVWFNHFLDSCGIRSARVSMATTLADPCVHNLESYDAIYIGGGNTYNLLRSIRLANFDQKIKKFLSLGKIVFGGSAGAIVMAKSIRSVIEENQLEHGAQDQGLSLLGELSIRCHYTSVDNDLIDKFTASLPHSPLVAIPESAGLVVCNREIKVAGVGHVTIFQRGSSPVSFPTGHSLSI